MNEESIEEMQKKVASFRADFEKKDLLNPARVEQRIPTHKKTIASLASRIRNEEFGNILDSGEHQPDKIDTATIARLKEELAFYQDLLAKDEAKLKQSNTDGKED